MRGEIDGWTTQASMSNRFQTSFIHASCSPPHNAVLHAQLHLTSKSTDACMSLWLE